MVVATLDVKIDETLKQTVMDAGCFMIRTEKTAHIYIMACSIGTPHLISEEHVRAMQHFARNVYGQRPENVVKRAVGARMGSV